MYVPNHPKNKNIFKRAQQFRERTVPAPTDRKGLAGSSREIALRNGGKPSRPPGNTLLPGPGDSATAAILFSTFRPNLPLF
jgi:hypothetical protein